MRSGSCRSQFADLTDIVDRISPGHRFRLPIVVFTENVVMRRKLRAANACRRETDT